MHVPHGVYSKERVSMSWLKLWHALQKVLLCSSVSCFDFFRAHCKHSNLKQRKEPEETPGGRVFSSFDYAGGHSVPLETRPPGSDSPRCLPLFLEATKQIACLWSAVEMSS